MHKMAFAHVFGPEKKNGFGPFSFKFFVCIRVGLPKTGSVDGICHQTDSMNIFYLDVKTGREIQTKQTKKHNDDGGILPDIILSLLIPVLNYHHWGIPAGITQLNPMKSFHPYSLKPTWYYYSLC